jgi:hypothetical protein
MSRRFGALLLGLVLFSARLVSAQDESPAILITSPDVGTTFAYGTLKTHALAWNKKEKMLVAEVTFTESEASPISSPDEDTHVFRLPGVTFDEAKGLFFATSAGGEAIPVAQIKKVLFFKSIETTPNAIVRVLHPRGNITVVLEAISPNDPAMHPAPSSGDDSEATH